MHIYISLSVYIYIYIHTCVYIYIYIYIYLLRASRAPVGLAAQRLCGDPCQSSHCMVIMLAR